MTTRLLIVGSLLCATACKSDFDGTFVGNPSMSARYLDNDTQRARGGQLTASEMFLIGCDGISDLPLGPIVFRFDGGVAIDPIQVPAGDFCGIFFVGQELTVRFDEGGPAVTSITGTDFDLTIPVPFAADPESQVVMRLGDDAWIGALAELSERGVSNLVIEDDALRGAFFEGLMGSTVEVAEPATPSTTADDLAGRLDLGGYPESPSGFPTELDPCGPGTQFHMGVPIPPAAMAAMGLGTEVGWCEGEVFFDDPLAENIAEQVDYSDGSTYPVTYNGWGLGCPSLHCNAVVSSQGDPLPRACTVLAFCDPSGTATVTGYSW